MSAKTPGVAKVLEDDEEMSHTIERVPSKSFKRLSQVEPPAAAAAAARGIEPVAETTAPAAVPPAATVTPVMQCAQCNEEKPSADGCIDEDDTKW